MVTDSHELEVVSVSSPCRVSWNGMIGDDQVRFCEHCGLNVYNLSEMTRKAATDFIKEREGRLCVRFYRRRDGTVVTRECTPRKRGFFGCVTAGIATILAIITLSGCTTSYQGDLCVDDDGQSSTNAGLDSEDDDDGPELAD